MPACWLVAGPNGSGKSTLARELDFRTLLPTPEDEPFLWINPDDIRRELAALEPTLDADALSLKAAQEADRMVSAAVAGGRSFARETVMSTERLFADLENASRSGFRLGLIFVMLRSPELNVARVRARVAMGGHDVPDRDHPAKMGTFPFTFAESHPPL